MRALQNSVRSSLTSLASAVPSFQHSAASGALQQCTAEQQAGAKTIHIAAAPLLSCSVGWNTGNPGAAFLIHPEAIRQRHSRCSHSQPATRPAAVMASERQRQLRDTEHAASAAGPDEQSGARKTTLWQQLRVAGRHGVKRSVEDKGEHRAAKSAREIAARGNEQRHKQSSGSATQRQAQVGRKGATDLGQGALIKYSPSMFSGTEAAQLLRTLQVGEHTCFTRIRSYSHLGHLPQTL